MYLFTACMVVRISLCASEKVSHLNQPNRDGDGAGGKEDGTLGFTE